MKRSAAVVLGFFQVSSLRPWNRTTASSGVVTSRTVGSLDTFGASTTTSERRRSRNVPRVRSRSSAVASQVGERNSTQTGRSATYSAISEEAKSRNLSIEASGTFDVPRVEPIPGSLEIPHLFYMFACALAEVEVDVLSGAVKVTRLVVLPDAGRVINPQTFEGQVEGAAIQGLGYALIEEAKIEDGFLKTPNFATYLIPTRTHPRLK